MRSLLLALLLSLTPLLAAADESTYVGVWKTTNRPLDGTMTCVVKDLGDEKWQGRFHGVWYGVPFDYTVPFTGPPNNLKGTATIDGASYAWTGAITPATDPDSPATFKATFTGNRYLGSFDLKQKPAPSTAAAPRAPSTPRR